MTDYRDLFIEYVQKTAASSEELTDQGIRQKHDRAMTSLHQLMREKMYAEPDRCAELALHLMEHPDERVRLNAAAYCLQAEVHQEEALALLNQLGQDGSDELIRLNAELSAMCCVPFSEQ